ncbi:methyltransferase-like protein 22 isoform X2 [Sitophilus oryzae]|uniref:Methyltransferase-like protein 22 isoform X2 n=1 Tax=Sitophilus oryzae TaxID=7048 RepID=A0A6J2YA45_SITOR|nr:methyltransferase-like protein 22 isoform X2 [Sitophilus oryzae]
MSDNEISETEMEDFEISSELYEENDYKSRSKPSVNPKNVVSKFSFKLPTYSIEDSEGDLIVPRRNSDLESEKESIEIEHSCSTSLDLVGHQIWRGSLLLSDWLLHNGKSISKDEYILELGSGVGLTSVIASLFCPVICTDVNRGQIFDIIKANVVRNRHITKYPVEIEELDFKVDNLSERIIGLLPKVSIIIAADVVYDDHLTDAFIKTVQKLLDIPPKRALYVALEKRYVFTIRDCDTSAPCYDYFVEKLSTLKNLTIEEQTTDFPQYFVYDKVKELVLWKITSNF